MSGGGTGEFGFNVRLRDSQARKDFDRDCKPEVNEISEAYFQDHLRKEAERKAREAAQEEEKRVYWTRIREIERRALNKKLMAIMWESENASATEREQAMTLVRQYNPEMADNVDFVRTKLLTLRSLLS